MIKIILNADLRNKLPDMKQPVEFYDESGNMVGRFIPYSPVEPPLPDEEWQRIMREPDFSTDEVLRHLESISSLSVGCGTTKPAWK